MRIDFKLPELGENIESGDVVNVLVREGEEIEGNHGVVELETDKAVVEIPCPHAGRIAKIYVKKGDSVKVGQTILTIETDDQSRGAGGQTTSAELAQIASEPEPAEQTQASPAPLDIPETIPAGPAARRIARELGVNLSEVQGSGARGRITPEDVRAAAKAASSALTATAQPGPATAPRAVEEARAGLAAMEPVVPPG